MRPNPTIFKSESSARVCSSPAAARDALVANPHRCAGIRVVDNGYAIGGCVERFVAVEGAIQAAIHPVAKRIIGPLQTGDAGHGILMSWPCEIRLAISRIGNVTTVHGAVPPASVVTVREWPGQSSSELNLT